MLISKLIHFSLIPIVVICLSSACDRPDEFRFPYVEMNITMNILTDAEFISLQAPSMSLEIINHPNGNTTIGYDNNGIILFNSGDYNEPFYAFDRTCPHDLPKSIAIELDGSVAICPSCKSVYVLPSEGQPTKGSVSKYFLHKYRTNYYPNGNLFIGN